MKYFHSFCSILNWFFLNKFKRYQKLIFIEKTLKHNTLWFSTNIAFDKIEIYFPISCSQTLYEKSKEEKKIPRLKSHFKSKKN
jgi:hypothetical protein